MFVLQSPDACQLVRVATAARWLKKDTRTIRWYIETGKLPAVRVGKLWFIAMDAVKAFRPRCQPRRKAA
jgi:excisionase family DNA binding protein